MNMEIPESLAWSSSDTENTDNSPNRASRRHDHDHPNLAPLSSAAFESLREGSRQICKEDLHDLDKILDHMDQATSPAFMSRLTRKIVLARSLAANSKRSMRDDTSSSQRPPSALANRMSPRAARRYRRHTYALFQRWATWRAAQRDDVPDEETSRRLEAWNARCQEWIGSLTLKPLQKREMRDDASDRPLIAQPRQGETESLLASWRSAVQKKRQAHDIQASFFPRRARSTQLSTVKRDLQALLTKAFSRFQEFSADTNHGNREDHCRAPMACTSGLEFVFLQISRFRLTP